MLSRSNDDPPRRGSGASAVRAFPWATLERTTRAALAHVARVRSTLTGTYELGRAQRALAGLLGEPVELMARLHEGALPALPALATLRVDPGGTATTLRADGSLVDAMLSVLVDEPVRDVAPLAPLGPALRGGFHAIVLDVAKKLCVRGTPRLVSSTLLAAGPDPTVSSDAVTHAVTIQTPSRRHVVYVTSSLEPGAPAPDPRRPSPSEVRQLLRRLGELPLSLGLVAGTAWTKSGELAQAVPGDLWVPDGGLWVDNRLSGRGVVVARGASTGAQVDLVEGKIVVSGRSTRMPGEELSSSAESDSDDLAGRAALDAPVRVRVELAEITLPAKVWAGLEPGDVIDTNEPVGTSVRLTHDGRQVGEGDLVDVDGRLGVRVRAVTL